jgi:hypothetical protein
MFFGQTRPDRLSSRSRASALIPGLIGSVHRKPIFKMNDLMLGSTSMSSLRFQ